MEPKLQSGASQRLVWERVPEGWVRGRAVGTILVAALAVAWVDIAMAQQPGWNYSPYPGEGDRAAMGCSRDATPESHACLIVRCEDDLTVGLHVKTSRTGGDAGEWIVSIDDASPLLVAEPVEGSPYGGRFAGDVAIYVEALKHGGVAYLDPADGEPPASNGISLSGSLYAINQALYFCAQETPASPAG